MVIVYRCVVCVLLACTSVVALGENKAVVEQDAPKYHVDTVAKGLEHPWAIAFLPNNDVLVSERAGRLRIIREGELLPTPVTGLPKIYARGQGGLLGLLPATDFADSKMLYMAYSHGDKNANTLRIARGKLQGNSLVDVEVIFTAEAWRSSSAHYGGRMLWLPDGTLLGATGDGGRHQEKAQTLDNMFGKSFRINSDGSVPEDNPFVNKAGALPEIWSYGHRNPQALVYDADTNIVYMHEHGAKGGDELNHILPGNNYGWPAITHGVNYNGSTISPYTSLPGMEQPLVYWVPSIAPSGMALYRGDKFASWRNNLFIAALKERSVRRLEMNKREVASQEVLFTELGERIREVQEGPDGYLYLLTDSPRGKVLRIRPTQ
ncbi:PQQ-dependent sugar dehydrogenase [bacterium SCSIO 12696]|nr:PQQ-dependent sugar dehydrogenase [bacterium SCSIO 12696]